MFLVDDLLMSPFKGLVAICRKVQQTAHQELESEQQAAVTGLGELHRLLASGQIDDKQFEARETLYLDRLEKIQRLLEATEQPLDDGDE